MVGHYHSHSKVAGGRVHLRSPLTCTSLFQDPGTDYIHMAAPEALSMALHPRFHRVSELVQAQKVHFDPELDLHMHDNVKCMCLPNYGIEGTNNLHMITMAEPNPNRESRGGGSLQGLLHKSHPPQP